MSGLRLPRTLFGGRMRTSTAILAAAFVGVLLLWYAVRPDPETVTEEVVRVTRTVEKQKPAKETGRPAEVERPAPAPTPTGKATRTPTPRPARTAPSATVASPSASTDVPPPPPDTEEPAGPTGTSPPKGGGLFENLPAEPRR